MNQKTNKKGPNKAVSILQELGALPETDDQRISGTRDELIQMHSTAVSLLKAQQPLADIIRSEPVKNSPNVGEIVNVVQGILTDSTKIRNDLITSGKQIKKMDEIKDPDTYLLQSINVHQSLVSTIEQYQAVIVPQLIRFDELVHGPAEQQPVAAEVAE